jgi:hypothetical protein
LFLLSIHCKPNVVPELLGGRSAAEGERMVMRYELVLIVVLIVMTLIAVIGHGWELL